MISGQVFLDIDQDGVFNGADMPLPGRTVQVGPENRFTSSDAQGDFHIVVPSGVFTLTAQPGSFEVLAQAPPVVDVTGQGIISSGNALAMNALSMQADLAISGTGMMAFPGFHSNLGAGILNEGTIFSATGTLSLTYDPLFTFVASLDGGTMSGNTVTWDIPSLAPGEAVRREMILYTLPSTPMGTSFQSSAQVTMDPPDAVPANDQLTTQSVVTSSWDPNDIQVWPQVLTPEEVASGRSLEYMIRFQNTGTASAQNVRITDALPPGVDPSSFQFIASSHPCHTNYRDEVLEFLFDGIMLPDSNANEPESHGFVVFTVRPVSTLLPGEGVWNRAYIYFDFNEAVVTNAATFQIDAGTAITGPVKQTPDRFLWPNPADEVLYIALGCPGCVRQITIVDGNGRSCKRVGVTPSSSAQQLYVGDLPPGVYAVLMEYEGTRIAQRFLKEP